MQSQLLTTDQAAEYLAISPAQIHRLRAAGLITPIKLGNGRALRWHVDDLDSFIASLRAGDVRVALETS